MDQALGVIVIVLLALGLWQLHVHFFPWKSCPACRGKGRRYSDGAWRYGGSAHADCKRCGSTGRVRRWGAPGEER